jgi:hypothetical protein
MRECWRNVAQVISEAQSWAWREAKTAGCTLGWVEGRELLPKEKHGKLGKMGVLKTVGPYLTNGSVASPICLSKSSSKYAL